ncbi:MAG: orotidine-5'-phosphate decarboxylase [Chloroflexi bacterium]|nr:MAG: orotidine-5'-phosphate decarboxylase [Chloroflexota bacterium]
MVDTLRAASERNTSLLCVGLDPDPRRFPAVVGQRPDAIGTFNKAIIDATSDLVCCYKPNLGFYIAWGAAGFAALARLRDDVPSHIPILLDAKVGDIDTTTAAYARGFFEEWRFDAVTANPFLGEDALLPLLERGDKGVFILSKTSNPGSGLLQDRLLLDNHGEAPVSVSITVARHARAWNSRGNVGLVVGATYPAQLAAVRAEAPDLPILVPGIGVQAGDLEAAVRAGVDERGGGLLLNASRAITYASSGADFQEAARAVAVGLRDAIERVRYA